MPKQTTLKTTLNNGKEEELKSRIQSTYPTGSYALNFLIPNTLGQSIIIILPDPWSQDMKMFLDSIFTDAIINSYEQV